jgi:hypothetical protein
MELGRSRLLNQKSALFWIAMDFSDFFGRSPTDNRGRVRWIIQAPPGSEVELTIRSERAGAIHRTITLR